MAFDTETFTPAVNLQSRANADVEVVDGSLVIRPEYALGSTIARYGGCLVVKDSGTQRGISAATENSLGVIFGMTHASVQDLSGADYRENPNNYTKHLGSNPGVVQGTGNVWIRRYTGTVLPNDLLVVGPSGYPKKSGGTGTIVGLAVTSGVGNVGSPTTSIMATISLPAFSSGLAG